MALDYNQLNQMLMEALNAQKGYVGGLGNAPTVAGPTMGRTAFNVPQSLQLSSEFRPTLDAILKGGLRTETEPLKAAMGTQARQGFARGQTDLQSQLAAMGLTGSSAQAQRFADALASMEGNLALGGAQLDYGASEAAAGRRMGALPFGLQEAQLGLDLGGLQLEGQKAGSQEGLALEGLRQGAGVANAANLLASRGAQAGAGQGLAEMLAMLSGREPAAPAPGMPTPTPGMPTWQQLQGDRYQQDRIARERQLADEARGILNAKNMARFQTDEAQRGKSLQTAAILNRARKQAEQKAEAVGLMGAGYRNLEGSNQPWYWEGQFLPSALAAYSSEPAQGLSGLAQMAQAQASQLSAMNQGSTGAAQAMSPIWQQQQRYAQMVDAWRRGAIPSLAQAPQR